MLLRNCLNRYVIIKKQQNQQTFDKFQNTHSHLLQYFKVGSVLKLYLKLVQDNGI